MKTVCLVNLMEEGTRNIVDRSEHLGLNTIAAYLESRGLTVRVIDANFYHYSDDQIIERIKTLNPLVVGFSLYENMLERIVRISREVKQSLGSIHVCLGGHNASLDAEVILSRFREIDTVIVGEGEETCFQLVTALINGADWKYTEGVAYYDGRCLVFSPRPLIANLDVLPLARRRGPVEGIRTEYINISASRGCCYGKCSFCTTPRFYGVGRNDLQFRVRSVNHLLDEMAYLRDLYGPRVKFWFSDDNFASIPLRNAKWIDHFISEIESRQLDISFAINARSDDVDEDTFTRLKHAGLATVFIGIESAVPEVLDRYNKGVTVESQKNAVITLQDVGLSIRIGWIMYEPYTRLDHLYRNIEFLEEIGYFTTMQQYRYPISLKGPLKLYPGTPILKRLQKDPAVGVRRTSYLNYVYDFQEPRVAILLSLLKGWSALTRQFILRDSLYLMETAANHSQWDLRTEVQQVSDAFMLLDLEYYKKLLELVRDESSPGSAAIKHREILEPSAQALAALDTRLADLQERVCRGGS